MTDNDKGIGSILAMELVSPGTTYTLSIAPCDDYQYWNQNERFDKFRSWIRLRLRMLPAVCTAYVELSPKGRLHMHGTIRFTSRKDIYEFYLDKLHSLLRTSQVEIDTIQDENIWNQYCAKQLTYFHNKLDLKLGIKDKVECIMFDYPIYDYAEKDKDKI